jgi:hypothetical protein
MTSRTERHCRELPTQAAGAGQKGTHRGGTA